MTGTTASHRVHGLADELSPPDWPPLTDREVAELLSHYPTLRAPFTIAWHSPRPLSAAARVQTANGDVFVKRHHASIRTPENLRPEHRFVEHLQSRHVPIPGILTNESGDTITDCSEWTYEVHEIAHGVDVYRDRMSWIPLEDLTQARAAGRMLARLHLAASDYQAPQRNTWILVSRDELLRAPDLLVALGAQLHRRPALATYLGQRDWRRELATIAARHRRLQPRLAALPALWTHNDWHVSNLFWSSATSDARITAILDFGLAARTFALYDLATAIERNAIAWLHLERGTQAAFSDTARALIAGYDELRPLDAGKRALLAELLPLVHIEYALSEVEYFQSVTHAPAHADVAWYTFLLGHNAWFDTGPGQWMLAAIRES